MAKKTKSKPAQIAVNELINSAVQEGVGAIVKDHPRFKNYEEFILKHLDKKELNQKFNELYNTILSKKVSPDDAARYIHRGLANYVASGALFDDAGKEVILKKSLEEKAKTGFFKGFFARRKLEGEKYLDNTVEAFQDLYGLMQQGKYAERMPEVAESLQTIYDVGFLDPALDILKHYRLIDKSKYNSIKNLVIKKTEEAREGVIKGIEKYATAIENRQESDKYQQEEKHPYRKAAAFIFGILGIFFLLNSKLEVTGAIIGASKNDSIMGILLIIISFLLFFIGFRK